MAKRELITREDAIKTVSRWIKADMTLGSSLFEMMMNEIPAITEQEIVKPYLEKLKADIEAAYDELDGYDPDSLGAFASRIDDLIDNMLSESEGA